MNAEQRMKAQQDKAAQRIAAAARAAATPTPIAIDESTKEIDRQLTETAERVAMADESIADVTQRTAKLEAVIADNGRLGSEIAALFVGVNTYLATVGKSLARYADNEGTIEYQLIDLPSVDAGTDLP